MLSLESQSTIKSGRIFNQLKNISTLPPIPKVLNEMTQLFNSRDISAKKIENLIEKDPSLTLKVLSVANSPLFGLKRSVNSVGSAILILGVQEIKSIITSIKMAQSIKIKSSESFDPVKLLNHSMCVGVLAQRMSGDLGFNFDGDCFVAGMLHDMGIIIVHEYLHPEFLEIVDYTLQNNTSFLEAEYAVLGLSHQEIGEFLTNKWSLPLVFSDALQFHHRPAQSKENNYLTSVIHIADFAASIFDESRNVWDSAYKLDESTINQLNFLSIDNLSEFIEAYRSDYNEVSKTKLI